MVWIHASNPTRFEQGYRDIANKIPIPGREDPKADILQLVCAWLSDRRNGQWLMILDNADDDNVFFAADEDSTGAAQISDITSHTKPLESYSSPRNSLPARVFNPLTAECGWRMI